MRTRLVLFFGLIAMWPGSDGALATEEPSSERPPNVVIVFADDLGYGDLGCYGAKGYQTPNLDRMAAEGVRFTDFYVAQAVCSASRAALLTGCYPNRLGILGALGPRDRHGIHDGERTIADVLKARGYATAIFGKWHLGHHLRFLPTKHGFDEYFGLPYSNDMWPRHPEAPQNFPDLPLIDGQRTVETNPDQSQLTTWYTEHALRFIEAHREGPFFVYLPHSMSHVPLAVSEKFRGHSQRGLFGDVIEEIDWSVGQILKTLKRWELDERTLVIFSADNGPWLSYGDHAGSAGPLREGKGTTFEGGVRVPCLMRWPGRIPPGAVCCEPAMTIDLLPTIAALATVEISAKRIDGRDIWPLASSEPGARSPHEALYFYWGRELQALRSGRWKLHFTHDYVSLEGAGGQGGKPAPYVSKKLPLSLFDLAADRCETANVVAVHPDVVARLKTLADMVRDDLGDSLTGRQGRNVRPPGMEADAK
jgi:arylsulfatase A-like enzyme